MLIVKKIFVRINLSEREFEFMNGFTNPIIMEEKNRHLKNVFIGFILLGLCLVCILWGIFVLRDASKNMVSLSDVIINQNNKEDVLCYVNSEIYPYLFASYSSEDSKFYLIRDEKYMYVAYMSSYDYERLKDESLYVNNHKEKLVGISKLVPTDVKKLAIEALNELWPDEEITLADYENYFGNVYLDMTADEADVAFWQNFLASIFGMIGLAFILIGLVSYNRFKKNIKRLLPSKREEIDKETLSEDAFYYANIHLYLTPNYIVLMDGTFQAISYNSLLWLYKYEQRVNGVKSTKSIIGVTEDGKSHNIAVVPALTKKYMEIYEEVFNTICKKNEEMLVGYTKENCTIMREELKKIKASNKSK